MKTREFDAARYLKNDEMMIAFLADMLENGTQQDFINALNTVARAKGMSEIASKAGIGRESLYKTLTSDKPRFDTIVKIVRALGGNFTLTRPQASQ